MLCIETKWSGDRESRRIKLYYTLLRLFHRQLVCGTMVEANDTCSNLRMHRKNCFHWYQWKFISNTGVEFWPLSDIAVASNLDSVQDFNRHTCWTPPLSSLTIETYITVRPPALWCDPLVVQLWMKNVSSCGEEANVPLVVSLLNPPSYKATPGGDSLTTSVLSMIVCDVLGNTNDGGQTLCAFECPSNGKQIIGHAFRLASLISQNAHYGLCEITYANLTAAGIWSYKTLVTLSAEMFWYPSYISYYEIQT